MKKNKRRNWLTAVVAVCIAVMFILPLPSICLAEAEQAEPLLDVTGIVVALISLVTAAVSALLVWVWKKYMKPWLVRNNLMDVAEIVVNAVEAIKGRYNGAEKWALALEKMAKEYGYNIEDETVLNALRVAWKQLDLKQLLAGEKEKPPETAEATA